MIVLDPAALVAAIALCEPLNILTITFGGPTFDRLKSFQRKLGTWLRSYTGSAKVLKYLIQTHPEMRAFAGDS